MLPVGQSDGPVSHCLAALIRVIVLVCDIAGRHCKGIPVPQLRIPAQHETRRSPGPQTARGSCEWTPELRQAVVPCGKDPNRQASTVTKWPLQRLKPAHLLAGPAPRSRLPPAHPALHGCRSRARLRHAVLTAGFSPGTLQERATTTTASPGARPPPGRARQACCRLPGLPGGAPATPWPAHGRHGERGPGSGGRGGRVCPAAGRGRRCQRGPAAAANGRMSLNPVVCCPPRAIDTSQYCI